MPVRSTAGRWGAAKKAATGEEAKGEALSAVAPEAEMENLLVRLKVSRSRSELTTSAELGSPIESLIRHFLNGHITAPSKSKREYAPVWGNFHLEVRSIESL